MKMLRGTFVESNIEDILPISNASTIELIVNLSNSVLIVNI